MPGDASQVPASAVAGPESLRARMVSASRWPETPPLWLGVVVAATLLSAETALVSHLKSAGPGNAFGAVFLVGVLVVSAGWGRGLSIATTLASAAVYVYFHLGAGAGFVPTRGQDLIAVLIFVPVALLANFLASQARIRAAEAEQRRCEADLHADLARILLYGEDIQPALTAAANRIAEAFELSSVSLGLDVIAADGPHAIPLRDGETTVGALVVPANTPEPTLKRLRTRVVPPLETLLRSAQDRYEAKRQLEQSRDDLRVLVDEQSALRRVATSVARGESPSQLFAAVTVELAQRLDVAHSALVRFDADGASVLVGFYDEHPTNKRLGEKYPLEEKGVGAQVYLTGRPARVDQQDITGLVAERAQEMGFGSVVGVPIVVNGRVWGAAVVGTSTGEPMPPDTETRMGNFTDLVATAVSNADARRELTSSRARIVTAADAARRRMERDLHDGAQQRLVSLGLQIRAAEASLRSEGHSAADELSELVTGIVGVSDDLREISRGIHPAILSRGGLGPALKAVARRSQVPAELDLNLDQRLPQSVEVTAYYVVVEALTNTARHADASHVVVTAESNSARLRLVIRDNGVGGANPTKGSGLVGLRDRVEALGGTIEVISHLGDGTQITVNIPVEAPLQD